MHAVQVHRRWTCGLHQVLLAGSHAHAGLEAHQFRLRSTGRGRRLFWRGPPPAKGRRPCDNLLPYVQRASSASGFVPCSGRSAGRAGPLTLNARSPSGSLAGSRAQAGTKAVQFLRCGKCWGIRVFGRLPCSGRGAARAVPQTLDVLGASGSLAGSRAQAGAQAVQ